MALIKSSSSSKPDDHCGAYGFHQKVSYADDCHLTPARQNYSNSFLVIKSRDTEKERATHLENSPRLSPEMLNMASN